MVDTLFIAYFKSKVTDKFVHSGICLGIAIAEATISTLMVVVAEAGSITFSTTFK
ncbi:hypothetical protein [Hathewaya histolytica]|uniref:hypothetical protein n=1 Tax=Hathewaya histolytica TaxID=1498 RepID=UPI0039EC8882